MIEYCLIIALISVILSNICLGSAMAKIKYEFNKKTFLNGLFKGFMIILGIGFMYIGAMFSKNALVVSMDGQNYNLIEAINVVTLSGVVYYGKEVIEKLIKILKLPTKVDGVIEDGTIAVPQENNIRGE